MNITKITYNNKSLTIPKYDDEMFYTAISKPIRYLDDPLCKIKNLVFKISSVYGSYLSYVNLPVCEKVGAGVFAGYSISGTVNLPMCKEIGDNAFQDIENPTLYMPNVEKMGYGAFRGCRFSTLSFSKCKEVGDRAFYECSNLTSIYIPEVEKLGHGVFARTSLISLDIPKCTQIGLMEGPNTLTTIFAPKLISCYSSYNSTAFGQCSGLETFYAPNLSVIVPSCFRGCKNLKTITLSSIINVNYSAFQNCSNLEKIDSKLQIVSQSAFYGCSKLSSITLCGSAGNYSSNIGSYAFYNCIGLSKVIIETANVRPLSSSNAFGNTPIANSTYLGYYGSIYVPDGLVTIYQSSTHWSYYKDRITGLSNLPSE